MVILDIAANRFSIIPDIVLERVNIFLESKGTEDRALSSALEADGLLDKVLQFPGILTTQSSEGLLEVRWTTPTVSPCQKSIPLLFKTVVALWKAGWLLKFRGFEGVVKTLLATPVTTHAPRKKRSTLAELMDHINKTFILDFSSNRCLSYALTLCLLGRKLGYPVTLVVGTRTRPFFSHAWVELDGIPINDDASLRKKLAVIMEV
ncbi:lasso peptide biosynthesis B2 protein [Achromobacter sp.]|uniref:lasso peptide biosynthesis B2 protein n=1 Tax=Achromobacter sp. TaxID=134375 RepID=UPI003D092B29